MSRLYDTIEPSVIDQQMLKEAVEDQGPKGEAGRIAKMEGIDFDRVLSLRLDYRSKQMFIFQTILLRWLIKNLCFRRFTSQFLYYSDILKIDNMWNFVSLTKLQMDNNIIEKMEGLDKLVNLEWLGTRVILFWSMALNANEGWMYEWIDCA